MLSAIHNVVFINFNVYMIKKTHTNQSLVDKTSR